MKVKIFFTKENVEDYFIIEDKDIESLKIKVELELNRRGLDKIKNEVYSLII